MHDKKIPDETTLRAVLETSPFLLFKHSRICEVSAEAFEQYKTFLLHNPDVRTGWVDVHEQRAAMRELAAETGVRHESPQVLLFREGKVVWSANHWEVTRENMEHALIA